MPEHINRSSVAAPTSFRSPFASITKPDTKPLETQQNSSDNPPRAYLVTDMTSTLDTTSIR